MEIMYLYTKVRSDFGKQTRFADAETRIVSSISPDPEISKLYATRNPSIAMLDTASHM